MDPTPNGTLPEVLARDLELSRSVFAERNMTSGAPTSTIVAAYKPAMTFSPRMSAPYRSASSRVQLLGAIEERSSMVTFAYLREHDAAALKCDETASDLDSLTGTEVSYDAGPSTCQLGERSIITNATSLASSDRRPSSKCLRPASDSRRESSWIEIDSDAEEDGGEEKGEEEDEGHSMSVFDEQDDAGPCEPESFEPRVHRKAQSMGGSTAPASRYQAIRPVAETWPCSPARPAAKRSSLDGPSLGGFPRASVRCHPSQSATSREPSKQCVHRGHQDDWTPPSDQHGSGLRRSSSRARSSRHHAHHASIGGIDIQSPIFELPFDGDELAKVVPLPPDVIETLRISTMCFPETMLLSSSLTIETVRSYSRKVRQPGVEPPPIAGGQQCANSYGQRSMWSRVVRRGSQHSHKARNSQSSIASHRSSCSMSTLDKPKPWTCLKNVFGGCSDYICDALYAHLVAYNYLAALVARSPSAGPSPAESADNSDDIPRKAATLLGLGRAGGAMGFLGGKKSGSSLMVTGQPHNEVGLRNIQSELLRCIRQLVATARLMAEDGSGEDRMVEMEDEDNDRLLMRSLCEIVRVSEGSFCVC